MEEKKKRKITARRIFNVMTVVVAIGLVVFFIFSKGGFIDFLREGHEVIFGWLIAAIALNLFNIFLDAIVIFIFLRVSTPSVTLWQAIAVGLTGQFYCAVTPAASGGQPMQIVSMTRMGIKGANGSSALIQKFLVWQFTLAAFCITSVATRIGYFAGKFDATLWIITIVGFVAQMGMIAVLLLASYKKELTLRVAVFLIKIGAKLRLVKDPEKKKAKADETLTSFHDCNRRLTADKKLLVKVYAITFVQMVSFFLVPYCIGRSFGINCGVFNMLTSQAYVNMIASVFPLPGGEGATEFCFSVFFGGVFTAETIKTAILLWRTITYYGVIALCAPFARIREKKAPAGDADPLDNGTDNETR